MRTYDQELTFSSHEPIDCSSAVATPPSYSRAAPPANADMLQPASATFPKLMCLCCKFLGITMCSMLSLRIPRHWSRRPF